MGEIIEMLQAGGPVVAILVVMSVVALAIMLAKLHQFASLNLWRSAPASKAVDQWQAGDRMGALTLLSGTRTPVGILLQQAMQGLRSGVPEARVREEVTRVGADMIESLSSWLRPLEVIAALAPLLGLFGTVLGMIDAFRQLEAAGNQVNPAVLSGGIWEALLTTAVGLAVAIPAVAGHNWLERQVERSAHQMDSFVSRLFNTDLTIAVHRGQSVEAEREHFRTAHVAAGE